MIADVTIIIVSIVCSSSLMNIERTMRLEARTFSMRDVCSGLLLRGVYIPTELRGRRDPSLTIQDQKVLSSLHDGIIDMQRFS